MGLLAPVVIMVSRRLLSLKAGFNGLLIRFEVSDVDRSKTHVVSASGREPDTRNGIFAPAMPFGVSTVQRVRHLAKIIEAIIKRVSVYVVDVLGPLSSHHAPYNTMGKLQLIEDGSFEVSACCNVSKGRSASKFAVPHLGVGRCTVQAAVFEPMHATLAPRQNTAGRIIFKKLVKNFAGKVGFSHWGLSERSLWSGLVEWWNTPQARIYTPSCRANAMREV